MKTIAIIGGGAAGLACAAAAVEEARKQGADVCVRIFEATDRIGRPILATGNGRCNFSNAHIDATLYRNADFAKEALDAFERENAKGKHPNGVVAFFAARGMLYREEGEGRLYPLANKASVVLDVLRHAIDSPSVETLTDVRIAQIDAPTEEHPHFTLRAADGTFHRSDAVVLACGGKVAHDMLPDSLDLRFVEQTPVLCSIATDTTYVRELDNIRAKATLSLVRDGKEVASEPGEVMFRKYGISGICAFNLSRFACAGDELSVDFLPSLPKAEVTRFAKERLSQLAKAYPWQVSSADYLRGMVLPRVADVIMEACGIHAEDPATQDAATTMTRMLKGFRAEVKGPGDAEHAQVTRGGFSPSGFAPESLEAHDVPGLHVVGEALDVDGPCGGYNLHWAFATGILAGTACVSR